MKDSVFIIGLGRMGERYLKIIKKMRINLIGIYDKNKKKVDEIGNNYKIEKSKLFYNLKNFPQVKPKFLIISTTAESHFNLIKLCSKVGVKNVMVEKPLATSIKECDEILKISKKNKIKICVNHAGRFSNQISYLKNIIMSKKLGNLNSLNYLCGNIGITMNGSHFFDIFNYLTGSDVIKVMSFIKRDKNVNPRGKKFLEYNGQILSWNKNGARGYIDASEENHHGQTLTCIFDFGIIHIDLFTGLLSLNYRKSKYKNKSSNQYALPYYKKTIRIKIDNVITMTKRNLKNFIKGKGFVNLKDGIKPIITLIAAITSSEKKKIIHLKKIKNSKKYKWA